MNVNAEEFVPCRILPEGGKWVSVETQKGFTEWPKPCHPLVPARAIDPLYRTQPCKNGEGCRIRAYCTFYHTEEEREVARAALEARRKARKAMRRKKDRYNKQYRELQSILACGAELRDAGMEV